MTRRTFFLTPALAAPLGAAVSFTEEMVQGETAIRMLDVQGGEFSVGVRTKVQCDQILVTVFYRITILIQIQPTSLLLSQESLAPCAGFDAYGGTRRSFSMPRESVEFIRLSFLRDVPGEVEFGR